MRPPWRAVGDDDVDRPQVGARRRVEPSGTNGPSGLRTVAPSRASEVCVPFPRPVEGRRRHEWRHRRGGAPLPIPNREVKPRCGDDTAGDRGKVVRRPPTTDGPNPFGLGPSVFWRKAGKCGLLFLYKSKKVLAYRSNCRLKKATCCLMGQIAG